MRGDILVSTFLDSVGGYKYKERRDHLLDILDVDLDWHMHAISDGERRRVQLCMGLMAPWDILLLDEVCGLLLSRHKTRRSFVMATYNCFFIGQVTVDLDVLVRDDLLTFLKNDSEARGATILCKRTILCTTLIQKLRTNVIKILRRNTHI